MEILNIKREEYGSGIPIKGLQTLKTVLGMYYSGQTKNSGATLGRLASDGGGIAAIGMMMLANSRDIKDRFLEAMFTEMESRLKMSGVYSRSYDYDGVGPFFKTTVTVTTIDKKSELYLLQLSAAYVGNKVEKGLAEALNIEQGLQWIRVGIEIKPVNGKFEIDFKEVMERVTRINGIAKISGEKAVKTLFTEGSYGSYNDIVLMKTKDLMVTLCPDDVARIVDYKGGQKKLTWSANGSVLTGPLQENYNERTKMLNPIVLFSVYGAHERLPILKTEIKKKAMALAEEIETAFGGRSLNSAATEKVKKLT